MKIISLIIFICLIFTGQAFSQASIKGVVTNQTTTTALVGATVQVEGTTTGTFTDTEGKYSINLSPGTYRLIFTYVGFEKYVTDSIKLETGTTEYINVSLKEKSVELPKVVIKGKPLEPYNYVASKVLQEDIQLSSSGDIGEYLRILPNVAGVRKGGNGIDPVIRGMKFHQLNVRVDGGIRIEGGCPNRMDPTASHIPLEDIQKIEVIKGPYALKFGLAFGGYVHLITSKPMPFKTSKFEFAIKGMKGFESNWNGNKEHIELRAGNNKVYFLFTGNRMKYGNYIDGNGDEVRSQYNKYAWSGEMGFAPKKNHEILLTYNEHYNRHAYFPALPMDEREDDTRIMAINYMGKMISPRIKFIKAKVFRAEVFHIMDNKERPFSDTAATISNVEAITQGFGGGIGLKVLKGTLIVGAGYENTYKLGQRDKIMYGQYPVNGEVPVQHDVLMDAVIGNQGTFTEYTRSWRGFDFAVAARLDFNMARSEDTVKIIKDEISYYDYENSETTFANVSFSFGFDKSLSEKLSIGLAMGRGVRSPNMIERFMKFLPVGYDNFDYLGNPMIKPEANHQIDLSLRYNDNKMGTFEGTAFYSYITDFITSKRLPSSVALPKTADVMGVKYFVNADYVWLTGFEFSYASPSHHKLTCQVFASYTYGVNPSAEGYEIDENGVPIGNITHKNDPIAEIPPLEGTILLQYKMLNGKLTPRWTSRFVATQNRISESYHERESEAFTVSDFSVRYIHNDIISIAAGINNVFDKAYFEHLNRRIIGTELCETCRVSNLYEPGRVFFVNMIFNIK